ncbi:peptidoglycan-binding protein [Streptomyces antioxidans]|uniref:Peptidoglycan-binding protein n=1 Tax=Streptomyces antioxidans TaxID=1507734 RepID=A0A1V4D8Q9_9ACTN|nr:peptidoglycan-binding protein [Streptomyces antioxidans]OPF81163.1 peptidoglycan-binding protein [Streptomyces antioxidans]
MSRWRPLPDPLDDRVRQLVVQLRRLKDRSGLGLSSLESKTGYSRSSWERYLNGKALPPRQAVEELARVGGVEPTRLLVLHEVAEAAWRERAATADDGPPVPSETPEPRAVRPRVLIGVCAAVALGALLIGLLIAAPWRGGGGGGNGAAETERGAAAGPSHGTFTYRPGKTYPCAIKRERGRSYAGYSTTRTAVLSQPGWGVVEAQCLLRHLGFDPGGADGVYGENTTRAVKRLQRRAGLPPDGIVGPHTWQVLRR